MSCSGIVYRISLHDGSKLDHCFSRDAAAEAIRHHYGWTEVALSDSYQDDDGIAWSAYSTQEECDADQEGAYAPRIIRVRIALLPEEVASKSDVMTWKSVASFVATFPSDDGEGACDVDVQIGEANGVWFVRTSDDSGGSDDADDIAYITHDEARAAAQAFADERDEGDGAIVNAKIKINIYRDGGKWFGARWIDGEYDGCDELPCEGDASDAEAIECAKTMPLTVSGARLVRRVDDEVAS